MKNIKTRPKSLFKYERFSGEYDLAVISRECNRSYTDEENRHSVPTEKFAVEWDFRDGL